MGYRQAVKAQDFDSCIVGSNPTSPVLVLSINTSSYQFYLNTRYTHFTLYCLIQTRA